MQGFAVGAAQFFRVDRIEPLTENRLTRRGLSVTVYDID